MCLIVDANATSDMFASPPSDAAAPVLKWVFKGDGRLVYGGQLAQELSEVGSARRGLRKLKQAGRAIELSKSTVHDETERVRQSGLCVSDDEHIIALARVSGARVLYSHDKKLHTDFTNKKLIDKPRGTNYQEARHAHLLCHTANCIGKPTRRRRSSSEQSR